jgi:glycosyltransferase involved in cell wall biosynthesis
VADKKPKILWANPYCLLDLSSGASMSVREQLRQLHKLGWDVRVLGATIFDSPNGITRLSEHWEKIKQSRSKIVKVNDGPLTHHLVKTKSTQRAEMTAAEEAVWYQAYTKFLDQFKPDIVYYYGGRTLDLLIGDEAHARGIPVAAYLANGNFSGKRWCREVDLVITNSEATAQYYKDKDNLVTLPIGPFVDPNTIVTSKREPKNVLAINPSFAKGAAVVAAAALALEETRPDITFEIVESRGDWKNILSSVQRTLGKPVRDLENIIITPNTRDLKPVYGRAKTLLILSLWWESLPRVAIEAKLNGIPCIATNRGGIREAMDSDDILIELSEDCYRAPYTKLPSQEYLTVITKHIVEKVDQPEKKQRGIIKEYAYDLKTLSKNLSNAFDSVSMLTTKDLKTARPLEISKELREAKRRLGYTPNLKNPVSYNEHIIRLKHYQVPNTAPRFADKLAAKKYVQSRASLILTPKTFAEFDSQDKFQQTKITDPCVIKSNHSCGQMAQWLNSSYGKFTNEWWYQRIKPKIYLEELIAKSDEVSDFKFFFRRGNLKLILYTCKEEGTVKEAYFSPSWGWIDVNLHNPPLKKLPRKPALLKQLVSDVESFLPTNEFVRVDLLSPDHINFYFTEFTFAPGAGWDRASAQFDSAGSYSLDAKLGKIVFDT